MLNQIVSSVPLKRKAKEITTNADNISQNENNML